MIEIVLYGGRVDLSTQKKPFSDPNLQQFMCFGSLLFLSFSIKESQDFTSRLFTTGFFVGHDPVRCGQDDMSKLSTGQ